MADSLSAARRAAAEALAYRYLGDKSFWYAYQDMVSLVITELDTKGWRVVRDDPYHYVCFLEDRWFIEHSLDCRIAGTIGTCMFNGAILGLTEEQENCPPGRWQIMDIDDDGHPVLVEPTGG